MASALRSLPGNSTACAVILTVDIAACEYLGNGSETSWPDHLTPPRSAGLRPGVSQLFGRRRVGDRRSGLPTDGSADHADPDHDGLNDWQEWICGTNPTNALSALRMVSALPTSTTTTVTWQSVAGVNYSVERSANLASPFTPLASNIVGQATTTSYTDTNGTSAGPFFYRMGVGWP